jgi:threonine dehydratase
VNLTFDHISAAARRIAGVAVRTPLVECEELSRRAGGRVLVKLEGLQRGGSFKFRGAYNRLAQLTDDERTRGVVAWSSGNHAQGVALAARLLGMPATIVMPRDAPVVKTENTRALGAEIVPYDRDRESRETIATEIARTRRAVLVPSYDDYAVMAGQGTVGLEIVGQTRERSSTLDVVLVPCGGGGLTAGSAVAIKHLSAGTSIHCVEPERCNDTARSLAAGRRLANDPGSRSICDALLAPEPGALTFPINQALLSGGLTVTDEEVLEAMHFACSHLKIVVEPGGAVALAAVLANRLPLRDRVTALIVSGSNVDAPLFRSMLDRREGST